MTAMQWKLNSSVGPIYIVASESGLQGLYWKRQAIQMAVHLNEDSPTTKILVAASKEIENYFSGRSKTFKVPLNLVGTAFQKKVWRALQQIPFGETRSYKDIANAIKHPKAFRAVGSANRVNPVCVIVPCHRVISSDGTLGGYVGGLKRKSKLLMLEKNLIRERSNLF